ncbi:MAG TPA: hypothetical protein ENG42_03550 [Candidatus Aenigmarchaeota archaeon]|nr:MAG: hypothetical protein DRP03_01520 [Candidatus Aenigmarchaeota archaeon]HDD46527.1 hypothetical protein [Candidatus Aenigmarchaeota archaeon]
MEERLKDIEKEIYNIFASVASTIGYSPIHGKIIGVLIVKQRPVSLQELAKETGYSLSMISLSLDFLEVIGVIKRIKKVADRKLYVELCGDLLELLKGVTLMRIKKSVSESYVVFERTRKELEKIKDGKEKKNVMLAIKMLEGEIKRLEGYVDMLSKIKLPKDNKVSL